jgi:hypothetical protein
LARLAIARLLAQSDALLVVLDDQTPKYVSSSLAVTSHAFGSRGQVPGPAPSIAASRFAPPFNGRFVMRAWMK